MRVTWCQLRVRLFEATGELSKTRVHSGNLSTSLLFISELIICLFIHLFLLIKSNILLTIKIQKFLKISSKNSKYSLIILLDSPIFFLSQVIEHAIKCSSTELHHLACTRTWIYRQFQFSMCPSFQFFPTLLFHCLSAFTKKCVDMQVFSMYILLLTT